MVHSSNGEDLDLSPSSASPAKHRDRQPLVCFKTCDVQSYLHSMPLVLWCELQPRLGGFHVIFLVVGDQGFIYFQALLYSGALFIGNWILGGGRFYSNFVEFLFWRCSAMMFGLVSFMIYPVMCLVCGDFFILARVNLKLSVRNKVDVFWEIPVWEVAKHEVNRYL